MKRSYLLIAFILCSFVAMGQPVMSPERRAELETEWMRDSLHATPAQVKKIAIITVNYQQEIDKLISKTGKLAQKLWAKKDAELKKTLNKMQYQRYYKRELQIRKVARNQKTDEKHRPY